MSEVPTEDSASPRRTLLLTGASRGIGHATVVYFAQRGWRVLSCSREDVPAECKLDRNWARHFVADLADPVQRERLISDVNDFLGDAPLHGLVNNAGYSPKTPYKERLGTLNGAIEGWRYVFELNFFAPLILSRGLAAALHRGQGAIVNITSIAGHFIHPFAGSAYSCSKAALSGLTREMAGEFAQLGVRVNAIAPGEIATEMISPDYDVLIPRIPLKRMGTPEDVAGAIAFLVSEEAHYLTGVELFVTGGQHLY